MAAALLLGLGQGGATAQLDAGQGTLRVTTSPVVDAPVRVDGQARNVSAVTGLVVAAGTHLVCFGSVEGYVGPPCETVTVADGGTTEVVGRFQRAGTLEVRTAPAGAGTEITVDGIRRDVGHVRIVVPVGSHEVCFGPLTGHTTPGCRTVRVTAGGHHATVGTYAAPGGRTDPSPTRRAPRARADVRSACPAGAGSTAGFADVASTGAHATAVSCAAGWGIVTGRTPTTFGPGAAVTRAQVATMLHRLIERTGADLEGTPVQFPDAAGSVHRAAIEALAGAGIVNGRGDGSFGPDAPVRRDQMAALLVRTLEEVYGLEADLGDPFADVPTGSVHATSVRRLVGAGITQGDGEGRYGPGRPVTRAQMATFVVRLADVLVQAGRATPPAGVR